MLLLNSRFGFFFFFFFFITSRFTLLLHYLIAYEFLHALIYKFLCGDQLVDYQLFSNYYSNDISFIYLFISDLWPSVLTPYFKEDVLYSEDELKKENEDGISTLFYLQKIYPG